MPQVKEFYHDVDLKANQLFNSRLHNITTASRITLGASLSTGDKGYVVYDTDLLSMFLWDGVQWQASGGGGGTWGSITGVITNQTDLINYLSSNYYPLSSNPAGYLTNETDPVFTAWLATPPNISTFNNDSGYLTSSALTGYVPYSGATGSVNLLPFNLTANQLKVPDTGSAYGGGWSMRGDTIISTEPYFTIDDPKDNPRILISGINGSTGFENAIIIQGNGSSASQKSKLLFSPNSLSDYTYTFPNATGTLLLGSGTLNYLPKWDISGGNIVDSQIYDDGAGVMIGTTTNNNYKFDVNGSARVQTNMVVGPINSILVDTNYALRVNTPLSGAVNAFGVFSDGEVQSDVVNNTHYFRSLAKTAATSFTLTNLNHFSATQGTFGIGSTVGYQFGFRVFPSLIGATTNNFGYYGEVPLDGVKNWNAYMLGTAPNYFNGNVLIGTTTNTGGYKLNVNGTFYTSGANTLGNLAGSGTRMVVADTNGLLSTQTIPSTNILKGTASGTDTYTTTITGPTSYIDGDAYLIRFTNGNTTGATLNINALGAKTLFRNNDGNIIGGDIEDGSEMLCVFNSTLDGFQVIGTSPNSLISYVTNDDSVTITKGQAVYAFSGTGDRVTVKLANNTADATSAKTFGLVMSTSIAPNQKGFIMMQGLLDGLSILPTATWSDGDTVYLGATNGSITNIKPYAPNHIVYIGVVTKASNGSSGRLYIKVQNGYELEEIHDVDLISVAPVNNDVLTYVTGSPDLWKPRSISTILGYTPQAQLNGTGFVKASGTTISYDNNTYLTEDPVILGQQAMGSTIKGVCLACRSFRDLVGGLQPVNGTLYLTAYYLSKSSTITGVKFYQSVGGVFTANNFNGFALFTYSAGVLTQVAITANDGNNWKATSGTTPSIPFTTPYSASAGLYFIGGIYSHTLTPTTVPIMGHGGTKITVGAANADFTNTSRFTATLASQTSMPSSITLSATTALTTNIAFYLY